MLIFPSTPTNLGVMRTRPLVLPPFEKMLKEKMFKKYEGSRKDPYEVSVLIAIDKLGSSDGEVVKTFKNVEERRIAIGCIGITNITEEIKPVLVKSETLKKFK